MTGGTVRWRRIAAVCPPFVLLWAAYFAFGLWLRRQIPFDAFPGELHGYDYNAHGLLLADHRSISFTRFRHPLFGWLMSPIPLFLEPVAHISFHAYWACLIALFSAVVTACVWLVYDISSRIEGVGRSLAALCAAAFACFGYMRYMAAGPESFPVSMLLALAVLRCGAFPPRIMELRIGGKGWNAGHAVWGALVFLSGGITITQGLKAAVAYVVSHRVSKKAWKRIFASAAALAVAGVAFYILKLVVLNMGERTIGGAVEELFSCIPRGLSAHDRLLMLEMFFFEPVVPHGVPYSVSEIVEGYGSWWPYAVCEAVYAMAALGAWRKRRTMLVRIIAATFAIDAAIHLVCFWGMKEAQIYCGHWFYALPILIACCLSRRGDRVCYNADVESAPEKRNTDY